MERMQTVVMTSATLTVAGRFDYLRHRVGLNDLEPGRLTELLLESPFDFEKQALLAIPTDIPEPGRPGYAEAVRDLTEQALLAADGRSFVLFTAYSLLRRIHSELITSSYRPRLPGSAPGRNHPAQPAAEIQQGSNQHSLCHRFLLGRGRCSRPLT